MLNRSNYFALIVICSSYNKAFNKGSPISLKIPRTLRNSKKEREEGSCVWLYCNINEVDKAKEDELEFIFYKRADNWKSRVAE